jgi:nitroimidazol reductase NimA-like FMN-containing flavoprotein (pyridoxamine 5'-phosphate oxidase superfamily)
MSAKAPVLEQPYLPGVATSTPWSEARQQLAAAGTYWLATIDAAGPPHVVPLLAVWVDDALHFVANAGSRKARNLARDARCTVTTQSADLDLVVEGEARSIRDEIALQQVAAAYAEKYGWPVEVRAGAFYGDGAPTAGPPPYDVYAMTFTRAFAFGHDEVHGPTRWRF